MERMTATPMHAAAHELTRARMSLVCAWHVADVTNGIAPSAFGISKAYATRRLGSTST